MAKWFWFFIIYSFLGFLVEVAFARIIHNPKRDRKCFYFLPLCPVYGLGVLLILLLPDAVQHSLWLLFPAAALLATGAEYVMGLFYEKVLGVPFWDYSHLPCNIGGKVCLLFTFFWGILGTAAVRFVHPYVAGLVNHIPQAVTIPALLFFALDAGFSIYILRRERTTNALLWYRHLGRQRAGGPISGD